MQMEKLFLAVMVGALVATPVAVQDRPEIVVDVPARAEVQDPTTRPRTEITLPRVPPEVFDPRFVAEPLDCAAFIKDLWTFVNANHSASAGAHRIGAKMSTVKIQNRDGSAYPWGHGSYSEGGFGWSGANLVGRFLVLFSDRQTADGAYFDKARADVKDVTLYPDGRVEVMLRSWGNAVLPLQSLQCYADGFLTGITREVNGASLVSFALRKEVIPAGSMPPWPRR